MYTSLASSARPACFFFLQTHQKGLAHPIANDSCRTQPFSTGLFLPLQIDDFGEQMNHHARLLCHKGSRNDCVTYKGRRNGNHSRRCGAHRSL